MFTKRTVWSIIGLLVAVCMMFGSSIFAATPAMPYQGQEITVLLIADKEFVPPLVPEFEKRTGIKVNVELVGFEDMLTKLAVSAIAKRGAYDVISGDIVSWRVAGYMESLDKYIDALANKDDLLNADMGAYKGKRYAMPWLIDNRTFVYNAKLLKEAGFDTPPQTPAEFIAQAKKLKEGGLEWPIMMPLKQHEGESREFASWLCSFGGRLFNEDFTKVEFNSEAGVAALIFLTQLHKDKLINPDAFASKSAQVSAVLQQGSAAFGTTWSIITGDFDKPDKSKVVGQLHIGSYPAPAGKQSCAADGSESLAIASDSKHKEAAWEFIKWITSPEVSKRVFLNHKINPVWKSLYSDPELVQTSRNLPAIVKQREKVDLQPPVPWYNDFSSILQAETLKAITGAKPPKQALDDAAAAVEKVMAR